MSKDLKDLIEKAEEEQASRAILEKTIEGLRSEVASLKKKLEEKKSSFKVEPIKQTEEQHDSEEISMLKTMINSLKENIAQKEENNKTLKEQMQTLKTEFEKVRNEMFNSVKDEMIIKTQNSLNNLIHDYGNLETENKKLKVQISKLHQEINRSTISDSDLQTEKFQKEQMEKEVGDLKIKIQELESNNQSLLREINNLQVKGDSKNFEEMLENLKSNNNQLEAENKKLAQKLEQLKKEKLKVQRYESEISKLKSQIQKLKNKDSILLAKTITAMSTNERKRKTVTSDRKKEDLKQEEVERPVLVLDKPSIEKGAIIEETKLPEPVSLEISKKEEIIEKLPDEADNGSITRKWQCPQCGNANKAQIRELNDKNRPIYAGFYAKKYICGQCGKEWR